MSASEAPASRKNTHVDDSSLLTAWLRVLLVWVVLAILWFAIFRVPSYLRAYAVLMHFADPNATSALLRFETHPVVSEDVTIPTANGPLPARLYIPGGVKHPRGMVAVHGIHHLGMYEPRLVSFAKAVAGSGIEVLTPQIDSLADYHVDAGSIPAIGESAVWLDNRLGNHKVTVTGISFAGGLTLLAAKNPAYAPHMRALVLMGAYDDLARTSRFLATSAQEFPDGRLEPHAAHDYGASVFVYAHLAQFFPPQDLNAAHDALRAWLWEHPEDAPQFIAKLSPESKATMQALIDRKIDVVRPRILATIQQDQDELATISPHGQIGALRMPVYILHGSADNIIPPAESLWIAKDLPGRDVRELLITGAFSHVNPSKDASLGEKLKLVKFVGDVLRAAN
jgi:dienelactone hydrolase